MVHQRRGELEEAEQILADVVSRYPQFEAAGVRLKAVRDDLGEAPGSDD